MRSGIHRVRSLRDSWVSNRPPDIVLELAFVLRAIKMAFGFCDQSGVIKLPKFVATDSKAFSRATRTGVRSSECPMELCSIRLTRHLVHHHDYVRKIAHEFPRAISAIAARPTAGGPSLTLSEPFFAYNAATLSGFWLHQASAYRFPNSFISVISLPDRIRFALSRTIWKVDRPRRFETSRNILIAPHLSFLQRGPAFR